MIMSIEELIDNVGKGDNVTANKQFDGVIADKLQAAIDARKIEIASTMGKPSDTESEE